MLMMLCYQEQNDHPQPYNRKLSFVSNREQKVGNVIETTVKFLPDPLHHYKYTLLHTAARTRGSYAQLSFTPLSHTDTQKSPISLIHPLWHVSSTTGKNRGPSSMSHSHAIYNKTPHPSAVRCVACPRAPAASCQPGTKQIVQLTA